MKTINFTKARENLNSLLDNVVQNSDVTIITRRDKPDAVVMSLDSFNSIMETIYLLSTPANAAHLMKSIAQHERGQVKKHDLQQP